MGKIFKLKKSPKSIECQVKVGDIIQSMSYENRDRVIAEYKITELERHPFDSDLGNVRLYGYDIKNGHKNDREWILDSCDYEDSISSRNIKHITYEEYLQNKYEG